MIIDADVHISPFPETGRIQVEELIRRMDRAGVERALTWLQPHYFRDVDLGNRYIVEFARYLALLDGEVPDMEKGLVLGGNIANLCGLV